jgi:glucose/arabinose dehydrogenase
MRIALLVLLATSALAQTKVPEPPPLTGPQPILRPWARGLQQPVGLVAAPGDPVPKRLYAVEKVGRVRAIRDGLVEENALLDVSQRVSRATEQGLLGLAFHPKYADNGRLFIWFTDLRGDIRISEWRLKKGTGRVDPASEREILHIEHHAHNNHDGGQLLFGPDGKLWCGPGDGGSHDDPHDNGQNRAALLGKILRIDVDADPPKIETHMIGARNPWRFSFDRKSGDLYIADVGQNKWEEIDVLAADDALRGGQNLGWAVLEGTHCHKPSSNCRSDGMTMPVVEYPHPIGCSVTGGFVYRGKALPQLDGIYFYSDFCTAMFRGFRWKDGRVTDHYDWKALLDPDFKIAQVASFAEDADGELYVISLDGTIFKMIVK